MSTLDRYMLLFQGRPDVFAQQYTDGSWSPVRRPITREDIYAHVNGAATYGIYPITNINSTKLIAFDIDTMDAIPRVNIYRALRELRIYDNQTIAEFSGRKGYHIWLPFEHFCPASVAYRAGQAVLQRSGLGKLEVYPKQAELDRNRPFGNLIKLPLGIHQVSGKPSRLIGEWQKVRPLTNGQVARLADCYEEPERPHYEPVDTAQLTPFARNVLTRECAKVGEAEDGDRNNQLNRSAYTLFGFVAAGLLDYEDVAHNLENAAMSAGLPLGEAAKTIASAAVAGMRRPIYPRSHSEVRQR